MSVQLHREDTRHIRVGHVGFRVDDHFADLMAVFTVDALRPLPMQIERDGGLTDLTIGALDGQRGVAARPGAVLVIGRGRSEGRVTSGTVPGTAGVIER